MGGASPRAGTLGERHSRHASRRINLSELGTGLFFVSLVAYFGYDGFKQIFTKPEPCESFPLHSLTPPALACDNAHGICLLMQTLLLSPVMLMYGPA